MNKTPSPNSKQTKLNKFFGATKCDKDNTHDHSPCMKRQYTKRAKSNVVSPSDKLNPCKKPKKITQYFTLDDDDDFVDLRARHAHRNENMAENNQITTPIECQTKDFKSTDPTDWFSDNDFYDDFFKNDNLPQTLVTSAEESTDLHTFVNVEIRDIHSELQALTFILRTRTDEQIKCNVSGVWMDFAYKPGDYINVKARKSAGVYCVTNDFGFVIWDPKQLLSGTTLMSTIPCMRRTVLAQYYKESINTVPIVTIGSLVHKLLQTMLRSATKPTRRDIFAKLQAIVNDYTSLQMLYAAGMDVASTLKTLGDYVDKISAFIDAHVAYGRGKKTIHDVVDIEENVWCASLGLRGKIDVTVRNQSRDIAPLEIKTGGQYAITSHRGQLALYSMMLEELGFQTGRGLLLYIRDNTLKEIDLNHSEKRDLMIMRNRLAYYLNAIDELPDAINRPRECNQCPYATVCASYLKENNTELPVRHCMNEIGPKVLAHLTDAHRAYFHRFARAIMAESLELANVTHQIWLERLETREMYGVAVGNLRMTRVCVENDKYLTTFERENVDFTSAYHVGEYKIVSTMSRVAVTDGFVFNVTATAVTLLLERDLRQRYANETFIIDNYDSNFSPRLLTSLHLILKNTSASARLRELIVDKRAPRADMKVSKNILDIGARLMIHLNRVQRRAILRVLTAHDYLLIDGMPGTGKTETICAMIQILIACGQSVIIASHTNSAVDNVLVKLLDQDFTGRVIRLGNSGKIDAKLRACVESELMKTCRTIDDIRNVYENVQVVGVTCYSAGHVLFDKRTFDVCIIDESTQVLQPLLFATICAARKFVLVGDPEQLRPIVRSERALKLGLNESLFERLHTGAAVEHLTIQYRMNRTIMNVANRLTYENRLECDVTAIANATIHLNAPKPNEQWLLDACADDLERAFVFVNAATRQLCAEYDDDADNGIGNVCEAVLAAIIVKFLVQAGLDTNDIGVIAPFSRQVRMLKSRIKHAVEINTVDQFQGRDKRVIVYSCAYARETCDTGLLSDKKRMTVAITRAKHKFLMIGSRANLIGFKPFRDLFAILTPLQQVDVSEGELRRAMDEKD